MERVLDGRVEEINRAWPYYNWLPRVFITVTVIDLRFGPLPQEMEGGGGSSDSVIVPQNYEFRCVPCFSPSQDSILGLANGSIIFTFTLNRIRLPMYAG